MYASFISALFMGFRPLSSSLGFCSDADINWTILSENSGIMLHYILATYVEVFNSSVKFLNAVLNGF